MRINGKALEALGFESIPDISGLTLEDFREMKVKVTRKDLNVLVSQGWARELYRGEWAITRAGVELLHIPFGGAWPIFDPRILQ